MKSSGKFQRKALLREAKKLAAAGRSVIPVHGDNLPEQPKKPAIAWRRFQREIMGSDEIDFAFRKGVTALGIVCGRVSRLLVVDFDDMDGYARFCRRFPGLVATRTVKTRRGCHLYFGTAQKVPSHQFDGGDIKGERSYVLAPPSRIANVSYAVVKDLPVRELSPVELGELLNHLGAARQLRRVEMRRAADHAAVDVARLYRRLAPDIGRNNALYRCASIGRDQGMGQDDVGAVLLQAHAGMRSPIGRSESVESRLAEGIRTIGSAFAKSASCGYQADGVPNALREFLLREQGSTLMARLLECMRLAGWREREWFSRGEAVGLAARFGLDRKSVAECLTGRGAVFNGRHIIGRRYVEYLDKWGLNAGRRGRPVRMMYQMPAIGELLRLFGLRWSPSDRITAADVKSARSYRLALHREYLRRLSPLTSLNELARRIGVNRRTIQRYNRELKVSVVEHVGELVLSRENLASLPLKRRKDVKNATDGFWLETSGGRRFPAWRHVGSWLLRAGLGTVRVCMRGVSRYVVGATESRRCASAMTVAEFVARRSMRCGAEASGLLSRAASSLAEFVKRQAARLRPMRIPLSFETVSRRIAEDKVAGTIRAYLCARDEGGGEVRRPALRGIAYRMLKEFGEGNVFMTLLGEGADAMDAASRRLAGVALQV